MPGYILTMAVGSNKAEGPVLSTARVKRRQKRRPRRLVESVPQDFARWDAAAGMLGLNFMEFARRALNQFAADVERADDDSVPDAIAKAERF
jgi:hypothetical protein